MHPIPTNHFSLFFFFNDPAPTEIYTLSLHDALPIYQTPGLSLEHLGPGLLTEQPERCARRRQEPQDRKSTRLNSSHQIISYAVFCLKKKKRDNTRNRYLSSGTHGIDDFQPPKYA